MLIDFFFFFFFFKREKGRRERDQSVASLLCPDPGSNQRLFKKFFLSFFLERGEGRNKGRERNINVWLPLTPLTGDWPATKACASPDRESNQGPFGPQASTHIHWATPARHHFGVQGWRSNQLNHLAKATYIKLVTNNSTCHGKIWRMN